MGHFFDYNRKKINIVKNQHTKLLKMPTNLTPIKLSFPEWLRLRREIAKLNQLEVAKAVGVTKQTISSWEKGISKPALNPYQTEQLCLILQITFEELVKGFNGEVEISIN